MLNEVCSGRIWPRGRVALCLLIVASSILAGPAAMAQAVGKPGGPVNEQVVEVAVVDSPKPIEITKTFDLSWPKELGKASARIDHWKVPVSNEPVLLPDVSFPSPAPDGVLRVQVSLKQVSALGVYSGQLTLIPQNAQAGGTRTFDIRFFATFKPNVTVAPAGNVTLKVSNCEGRCPMTGLFAPETQAQNYAFEVRNGSPAPIDVNVMFTALGVTPGVPVLQLQRPSESNSSKSRSLGLLDIPPNGSAVVHASVANAASLPSGAYSGSLQFLATPSIIRGAGDHLIGERASDGSYIVRNALRTDVVASVQVRSAAFWALVAILLGVVAGRVAGVLATAGFEQKLLYFPRYQSLKNKLASLPQDLRTFLESYLEDAWNAVLEGGNALTNSQVFWTLERQFAFAEQAELLRVDILKILPPGEQQAALDELEKALVEVRKRAPVFENVIQAFAMIRRMLQNHASGTSKVQTPLWPEPLKPLLPTFGVKFLSSLAGTGTEGVGFYYRYMRPLMHLTLLLVLVIYGMWQHYTSGADAATFGAQGISQYAMLFLWGVSSDIVNKTLQSISFKRP